MSKLAIGLGVLVLGSGASLTGAYALGAFDPDYELPQKGDDGTAGSKGFKQVGHSQGCVTSLFPGIGSLEQSSNSTTLDFSNYFSGANKPKQGCLVVNWDKGPTGTAQQWNANFRFLGAMKEENDSNSKGFIVFATGDTFLSGSDKKMKFKGVVYSVKNEAGRGKVETPTTPVTPTEQQLAKESFPKANTELDGVESDEYKNFGGLTDKDGNGWDQLQTLGEDARKNDSDYFRGYWTWKGDEKTDSKPANEGTSNGDNCCQAMFGTGSMKIKESLASVKGTWKKLVLYSKRVTKSSSTS